MVGILGLMLLKSTKVANHFKEKVAMTLFLKEKVKKSKREQLKDSLLKKPYIKSVDGAKYAVGKNGAPHIKSVESKSNVI